MHSVPPRMTNAGVKRARLARTPSPPGSQSLTAQRGPNRYPRFGRATVTKPVHSADLLSVGAAGRQPTPITRRRTASGSTRSRRWPDTT